MYIDGMYIGNKKFLARVVARATAVVALATMGIAMWGSAVCASSLSAAQSPAPAQSLNQNPENPRQNLDSLAPQGLQGLDSAESTLLSPSTSSPQDISAQAPNDMGNLKHHSRASYRYNTRFDANNALKILGGGGEARIHAAPSFYGAAAVLYDGLIDRYPLGMLVGYGYQGAISQSLAPNPAPTLTSKPQMISAQSLTLGLYSDVFFEEQHIQAFIAQSFQAANASASSSAPESWLFSSSTHATLSYGYVFAFGSSFLEPYARWNLHALYPMHDLTSDQKSLMSSYVLRSSLDIGVQYRQFLGRRVFFYLAPGFRQDIGVIGFDGLGRLLALDTQGQGIFALPDSRYHSYATLDLGLTYRASRACTLALSAHGIYTHNFYTYSAQLSMGILF